jgi:hypothetical protein
MIEARSCGGAQYLTQRMGAMGPIAAPHDVSMDGQIVFVQNPDFFVEKKKKKRQQMKPRTLADMLVQVSREQMHEKYLANERMKCMRDYPMNPIDMSRMSLDTFHTTQDLIEDSPLKNVALSPEKRDIVGK